MFIRGYLYPKLSFLNDLSLSIYLCDLCALGGEKNQTIPPSTQMTCPIM